MRKLIVKREQIKRILSEVKRAHPFEACALLYGSKKGETVVVENVVIVPNEEKSEVSFAVDPELFYKIHKEMEEGKGEEYVGIFHSHPAPPSPSKVDKERMVDWPNLMWLIYSTISNEFGAYVFDGERVRKVEIHVESIRGSILGGPDQES